uniref:EB domain-containing protein n=1 Tax=Romanomermis culicivorax TaxID=13658 RepID=A0A915L084_ROMCU
MLLPTVKIFTLKIAEALLNEHCTNSLFCLGDKICNKDNLCACPEGQVPTPNDTCRPLGADLDKVQTPADKNVDPTPIKFQSFVIIEPTYSETTTTTKNPFFPGKAKPGQLCSFEVSCTGKSRCYKGHCHCLSGYKMAGEECVIKWPNNNNGPSASMLGRSRSIFQQQLPQRLVAWPIFGHQPMFRRWN